MRKETWILIIVLVVGSMQLIGQQNFASISFGATIPQGNYAATGDLSSNGYANTGGAIKFGDVIEGTTMQEKVDPINGLLR